MSWIRNSFARSGLAALAGAIIASPGRSQSAVAAPEYAIKAVYLYQFTNFVVWPERDFDAASSPFVIGILGPDPFHGALEEVVRGARVGGHPIVVRHLDDPAEASRCQILYVDPRDDRDVRGRKWKALTVGETSEFLDDGGIVRFVTKNGRVRLQINLSAAKAAGLSMSSQLLRIAELIGAS